MPRRKTHKKLENTRLRLELRRALIDICAQSRLAICFFQLGPNYVCEYACVSGSLGSGWLEPDVNRLRLQRWENAPRATLQKWLEWAQTEKLRPYDPIPPLEMLAREAV